MDTKVLQFKWTVSRGVESYGYNICSLYVDGKKEASCNGGGYDMEGTALGEWIQMNFMDRLKKIKNKKAFYGLGTYKKEITLDGACGFSSMERIAKEIGIQIQYKKEGLYIANIEDRGDI